MLSADIRKLREDQAEAGMQVLVTLLTLFIAFSVLYIISTTIDYMHQLCFLYVKLSSLYSQSRERERERRLGYPHANDYQEFVSHLVPVFDELSSSV